MISYPRVFNRETSKVEAGASPQVIIRYKNTGAREVNITMAELYLVYDATLIDAIIGVKNEKPDNFREKEMDISIPGEITYKLETPLTNWRPISVGPGETVDLATITLHVKQTAPSRWMNILNFSAVKPIRISQKAIDITGILVRPAAIFLDASRPPEFSGLSRVVSANSLGVQNPGNTVMLDWITPGTGAFDRTRYFNGKLSFRVFRDTGSGFMSPTELLSEQPSHAPEDEPSTRAPYTGNLPGTDYVYQDTELDDGTTYYYKVTATDDTSPDPNVKENTTVLNVVPLDLTPPGEVVNPTAVSSDNKVTLRWENPGDADLGGVVIIRNRGRAVGAGNLGGAQAGPPYNHGPEYFIGDEPFGPGNGTVIFVSFQESDASMVAIEYEDFEAENGVVNHYKIFIYDRAVDGSPREMGRNYSRGISISKAAGIPPRLVTNFTAVRSINPGEVTFSWNNSPDEFSEGTLIRFSVDERLRFGALRDERAGALVGVFPMTGAPSEQESVTLLLPSGYTYYFKAFAYNRTMEGLDPDNPESMAKHLFSTGQVAAVNLPPEEAELLFTYTYNFQRGINHFAVPFPAERIVDELGRTVDISTCEKLIEYLNAQARENVVLTLGRWNEVDQRAEGIVDIDYTRTGSARFTYTPGFLTNTPIIQGAAYEISVSQPFTCVFRTVIPRTR